MVWLLHVVEVTSHTTLIGAVGVKAAQLERPVPVVQRLPDAHNVDVPLCCGVRLTLQEPHTSLGTLVVKFVFVASLCATLTTTLETVAFCCTAGPEEGAKLLRVSSAVLSFAATVAVAFEAG